jgi:D-3-phosphoglycerate dehydrogenase
MGGWDVNPVEPIWRVAGRTLGLVGLGNIGQLVARKMSGWGVNLLANDPFVEKSRADALGVKLVDLETLCREADYISLHVPLLPETRHLISQKEFAWMAGCDPHQHGAWPGRHQSIAVALREGRIA